MTQDILDANGNVIGELEFPDGTDQSVIDAALAIYAWVPSAPPIIVRVQASIQSASDFGKSLAVQYAASNVLQGITVAGHTQMVADYLEALSYYLHNGSLYAAINAINVMIADTSQTKTNLSPYVTNDILYTYLNLIQTYLGLPITPNPGS